MKGDRPENNLINNSSWRVSSGLGYALLEGIPDPALILKNVPPRDNQLPSFEVVQANQRALRAFPFDQRPASGVALTEFLPESTAKIIAARCTEVMQAGAVAELALPVAAEGGSLLLQRIAPYEKGVLLTFSAQVSADAATAYGELAQALPLAYFELDAQLRVQLWNSGAAQLTGYLSQKVMGRAVSEVFPQLRGSSLEYLFRETLRTQRAGRVVAEQAWADQVLLLEVHTFATSRGLGVFARDISRERQSESLLKASKLHLKQVLSAVEEVVFRYRLRPDGEVEYDYFSAAARQVWGYSPEELRENKYLLIAGVENQYQETFARALSEQVLAGNPVAVEYAFWHKDGTLRWIFNKLVPHRQPDGSMLITGIAADITNHKRMNDQIQSTNEMLQKHLAARTEELDSFVNAIPSPIFVVEQGEDWSISFCNTVFAQSLGYERREEVQGKTLTECFPTVEAERIRQQGQRALDSGLQIREQETVETAGTLRHYDTYRVPLHHAEGRPRALLNISHDITELVNARLALSAQTGQLETTNKELEAFSYSVSHDLRAPLRAIDGYTRILLEDYGDKIDHEGRRVLDVITQNAKKMGQLIDDLLDFSRLGRKEVVKLNFDTHKLVETLVADIRKQTPDRNIRFEIKPLAHSRGDMNMLKQVWINLLSNAVKYTRDQAEAVIEIGSTSGPHEHVFYVKDNGVGFDMQYSDKLFGVFQRLHTEEEFEGTGVGLAIAQRIVARHGGSIRGEGEIGKGAIFSFSLPIYN